jgi:hypothetical protein
MDRIQPTRPQTTADFSESLVRILMGMTITSMAPYHPNVSKTLVIHVLFASIHLRMMTMFVV